MTINRINDKIYAHSRCGIFTMAHAQKQAACGDSPAVELSGSEKEVVVLFAIKVMWKTVGKIKFTVDIRKDMELFKDILKLGKIFPSLRVRLALKLNRGLPTWNPKNNHSVEEITLRNRKFFKRSLERHNLPLSNICIGGSSLIWFSQL